jgi:hypothetical protein
LRDGADTALADGLPSGICTGLSDPGLVRRARMARGKKHRQEQVANLLRQIEVAGCEWEDNGGGVQGGHRSRNRCTTAGGVSKELEAESAKVKRLVVNLSLDNLVLMDLTSETSKPGAPAQRGEQLVQLLAGQCLAFVAPRVWGWERPVLGVNLAGHSLDFRPICVY